MRSRIIVLLGSLLVVALVPAVGAGASTTGSISGHVTKTADGTPVVDGWVWAIKVDDPFLNIDTVYPDATGLYTLDGLPPGEYWVQAGSFGEILAPEWHPNQASFDGASKISVAAGAQTTIEFALDVGGQITGTVTDAGGQPISGVRVISYQTFDDWFGQAGSWGETGSVVTAADGTYTITGLSQQNHYVYFGEGSEYVSEYYTDQKTLADAEPVPVTLGTTTPNIDANLIDGGLISGQVVDAVTGSAVANQCIVAYVPIAPGTIEVGSVAVSEADGSYRLPGLRTGSYYVKFEDCTHEVYATTFVGGDTEATATLVAVVAGGLVDIDVEMTLRFRDANTSVFREDIKWLAMNRITTGCGSQQFCTDKPVTRGQMAAFLARALNLPATTTDYFTDDDASIFEGDINRVAAAGITLGCNPPTNDSYCPDRSVTRGQMAAFLVRALGYTDDGGGNLFVDDDESVFEPAIDRLATAGVTLGCNPPTNDQYCPGRSVTRGQMAAFLHRALG